jgi:hypothetical protein
MTRRQVQIAVVASGITVAAATAVITPAWESTRKDIAAPAPAEHPQYPTQSRSREAVRAAHLRRTRTHIEDTAAEACERFSTATWAANLGVRPTPEAVARTLARRYYERTKRKAAYRGCLGTLKDF